MSTNYVFLVFLLDETDIFISSTPSTLSPFFSSRFEMVVILHKIIMTGALCVTAQGSSLQLLIAVLTQKFYMLLVLKTAPYEEDTEDWTSFISSFCLTLTGAYIVFSFFFSFPLFLSFDPDFFSFFYLQ